MTKSNDQQKLPAKLLAETREADGSFLAASDPAALEHARREAEARLRESEERYRRLVEQIVDGVFVADRDGRYVDVNPAGCQMLGLTRAEVLNSSFTDILAPEEHHRLGPTVASFADGNVHRSEWRFRRKDGSTFVGELAGRQLPDGRLQGIVRDITERKRAEQALRASEEKYWTLFNSIDEGFARIEMIFDEAGKPVDLVVLETNKEWERQTGLSNIVGKTIRSLFPDYEQSWLDFYGEVAHSGKPARREDYAIAADHWFSINAARVGGADSREVALIFDDITERKRREMHVALLAEITGELARLTIADEILQAVGAKVGKFLRVSHCMFAEIDEARDSVNVETAWRDAGLAEVVGAYRLSEYVTEEFRQAARAGETIVVRDTQTDPRTDAAAYAAFNIHSFVTVPYTRGGKWKYLFTVNHATARDWRADEVELVREITSRVFVRLERERATAELRESEERFRMVADNMAQLAWTCDSLGNVTWYNQRWLDYTGLSFEDTQGWDWSKVQHPDHLERVVERVKRSAETGDPWDDTFPLRGRDGQYRWFLSRALPIRDAAGNIVRWFGTNTDITEQLVAEEALRESKARFDIVKDAAQVGFWFCDLPFDKLIWDNRVKEHFWLPHDAEVTIDTFYEQLHPDDRERTRQAIDESIASQTQYDIEYRTLSPEGQEKWIRAIGRTFYDAQANPIRFDGVTLDITERRRAEETLKENDRRKDEFLAMLAHELRNPLAPIRNAAQILKLTGPAQPDQQWAREVIERQTQHLTRLVDDLLDVSRITQGKITLQREPLDLATIINRAIETSRPLVDARKHDLTVTLPPDPLRVEGDLTRLVQAVGNLLNNAAKYTGEGGHIQLSAALEDGEAVVRVRDNGMGLAADLLPRVFDLFTQADRSLDRSQGGLGIGLTLVRNLVELHGGRVEAKSDGSGRGSEFIVRLPAMRTANQESANGTTSASSPSAIRDQPLRVLVVEDNADSAEMMKFMLKLNGHEVRTATDGAAALTAARAFQPQVVLCDIGLPGMNGYEVAAHLRAMTEFKQTRLIAISGYGQEDDRRRAREAGFDYHLTKPVEPDAITALLDSLRSERLSDDR